MDGHPPMPRHVAVIMDGNGRWAMARRLPRTAGHRQGLEAARRLVEAALRRGIAIVTLYAFSTENWERPREEVDALLDLFADVLEREQDRFDEERLRLRFLGDPSRFPDRLIHAMRLVERRTARHTRMTLQIAVNYGGRADILQAARRLGAKVRRGELDPEAIGECEFEAHLLTHGLPDPDLLIRTGNEQRLSNFLLWNLAYTELYFTATLWPDFSAEEFDRALESFVSRERRFGRVPGKTAGL
jgi:undecaprenyl diphosphate synthase